MTPKRPYLVRALYDWIVDSELTPYVLVQVDGTDVVVPQDFVEEGRIVLNISPAAVRALAIENDVVTFSGRFGGRPFNVVVPMRSVSAIYAKETGEGMMFEQEYEQSGAAAEHPPQTDASDVHSKNHLKVIK